MDKTPDDWYKISIGGSLTKKEEKGLRKLSKKMGDKIGFGFVGFAYELEKSHCPNCGEPLLPYDSLYSLWERRFRLYDFYPKNFYWMFMALIERRNPLCFDCAEGFDDPRGQINLIKKNYEKIKKRKS